VNDNPTDELVETGVNDVGADPDVELATNQAPELDTDLSDDATDEVDQ
jgi:hypothetical protein